MGQARWRCPDPDCDVATWTEQAEAIAPRAVLTERARWEIFRRIGAEGRSTAEVARAFAIAWATAWAAFESLARPAVEDPARIGGVEALGIDEAGFPGRHPHPPPHLRHRDGRCSPGPAVRRHPGTLGR